MDDAPMDDFTGKFKTWMNERGLTSEGLAPLLNRSKGTIENWRSQTVPERARAEVYIFMRNYDAEKLKELKALNVINLQIPPDKHDLWNEAALKQGLIIKDWAIQGLDEMAKRELTSRKSVNYDFNRKNDQMVAEDEQDFNAPEDGEREED
jgi:hypothetical protein